ncbi:MAG: hypothetical protein AAF290_05595 [Pseudomonadota bacterium]
MDIAEDYQKSKLLTRSRVTQKEYARIIDKEVRPQFGHMHPNDLTQQDVAVFLECMTQANKAPMGNRIVAVLSSIYNHGMRIRMADFNPTYGVRRNEEKPKQHYVTDQELWDASKKATQRFRWFMWGLYLTGLRQKDLMALDITSRIYEVIEVIESKTNKGVEVIVTPSLKKLLRRSIGPRTDGAVFIGERGQRWRQSAVQSAMGRLNVPWTLHDLRAKAESDHPEGLGLLTRYNRRKTVTGVK